MHIYCQKGHFLAVAHNHRFSSFTVMLRSRKPTFVSLPLALIGGVLAVRLTSALALIPLVFNGDKPGNEIQSPMAIVVLGGLPLSRCRHRGGRDDARATEGRQGRAADPFRCVIRRSNGRPRHRCPDSDDVRLAHQLGGQHRVAQQLRDRGHDRYGGGVLVGGEVREGSHVAHCLSIRRALRGRACPCRRTRRSCRLWLRGSRRRRG